MGPIRSLIRQAHAATSAVPGAGLVPCVAALGLVLLQAGTAVSVWAARERGQFGFSPSSSLALSELLRFLVATLLLRRALRRRAASAEYASLDDDGSDDLELDLGAEDDGQLSSSSTTTTSEFTVVEKYVRATTVQVGSVRAFWRRVWGDADIRFGLLRIALLQMLSNNLMFLNYLATDPGTVHLTKSGIAVAAALVTTPAFGLKGPKTRWMAFLIQTSGLVISQFMPQHRTRASTYRLPLYTGLVGQASFGALSDIYSERLPKGTDLGVNGVNVVLGALGAVLNLLVHALVRHYNMYEPAFFDGYDGKGVLVVVTMAVTALVSTVAYKKANTWVRWFTNDATSVILLLVSAQYLSAQYSPFLLPGTALIFIASLAYMKYAPIKDYGASSADHRTHGFASPPETKKKLKLGLLTLAGFLGAGIVPFATLADPPHTPEYRLVMRDDTDGYCHTPPASIIPPFTEKQEPYQVRTGPGNLTASPFSNTLAMIRWNRKRTERVPLLEKYKPFFHTVHISMPDMMEDRPEDYHNLTHSQYPHHATVYMQVARTMRLLLDEHPDVEGLLYFHFDSWIDPLAWVDENRQSIWYPTSQNTRQYDGDGPRYMCMNDTAAYPDWWRWSHKWNERAVTANGELLRMHRGYAVREAEFCVGWSDIFYVPRRFFADFVFLSHVYGCADLFHEVAIPTMLNVIDRSRRSDRARYQSLIDRIGDCWGGCCDDSATAHDVKWTRCGHRLSYLNQDVVDAHYGRLDEQTAWLAQTERAKRGA